MSRAPVKTNNVRASLKVSIFTCKYAMFWLRYLKRILLGSYKYYQIKKQYGVYISIIKEHDIYSIKLSSWHDSIKRSRLVKNRDILLQ